MAEDDRLLDGRRAGAHQVVGMDVDVPDLRQEVGASEIDDTSAARVK